MQRLSQDDLLTKPKATHRPSASRRRFRLTVAAVGISTIVASAFPLPANAAILNFFGFGFSKDKTYKKIEYWVDNNGLILGIVGKISPPVGAVIQTILTLVRVLDPVATSIISGRATLQFSPGDQIVDYGWYGEFGADPTLGAPAVGPGPVEPDLAQLQSNCNPIMISCGISSDPVTEQVVFNFDWGHLVSPPRST